MIELNNSMPYNFVSTRGEAMPYAKASDMPFILRNSKYIQYAFIICTVLCVAHFCE